MPTLRAFGRSWSIASDDFVFPCLTEGFLRLGWFVITFGIYWLHQPPSSCDPTEANVEDLFAFVVVLLVLNFVLVGLSFATAFVSSRGTIMNNSPRRLIPHLLYLRVPFFVFEVVWNIVGTVWIADPRHQPCDQVVLTGVRWTVCLNWAIIAVFITGVLLVFNPLGTLHQKEHNLTSEKARRVWHRRIQILCICANADDNAKSAFEDVADLLSSVFYDNDLVLSDVWAGLLLMVNKDVLVMNSRALPPPDSRHRPEWMNVRLADRMVEFAMGMYGWPTYVLNNCSCSSLYELMRTLRCCRGCRCDQVLIIKDNCCQCSTAAFLLTTRVSSSELFFVSFKNRIYEVPFVASADPITKSIVVAIRGSASLRDAVTDLCAGDEILCIHPQEPVQSTRSAGNGTLNGIDRQPSSASVDGMRGRLLSDGADGRVHRGMLNSARYVYHTIMQQKILEDMYVLYPDFELVITGHSLGAGVATLVGLMLRPQYPNVRVFAFSPPGCVVCEDTRRSTEAFVCSVVLGDDAVPRLSYQSMERLKRNIVSAINDCEMAKYEILLKGCFKLLCGAPSVHATVEADMRHRVMDEPPPDPVVVSTLSPEWAQQANGRTTPSAVVGGSPTLTNDITPLIGSAGRHRLGSAAAGNSGGYGTDDAPLSPSAAGSSSDVNFSQRSVEDPRSASAVGVRQLCDIKLSIRMISDHLPYNLKEVLRMAAATVGDDNVMV